ncbi:MAG TPA: enoyl-CoA hydratase/isomerase family protein [Caulobacteraceae bacterium]|nr:enoyl-CoA hydratase/isomerase family protein [Caulobacteraceae bacterium]
MPEPLIVVKRDGPIATVTLDRAARRNAINVQMMRELIAAAEGFAADQETRVVIVRAQGGDFSVGADLAQPPAATAPSLLMRRRGAELGAALMRALQEIHQPTICAVQGVATGAGACIATACDFRVGTENVRIGYGEVKLGINLMWRAAPACVHLVGPARAKRMIMTGALFDAATLERWGFLDEVAPLADLDARALAWAEEYAALPPMAVQMIKRSVNQIAGALDHAIMHMDADQWLLATLSKDYREAVTAFFEKRPPTFTGD